jgi:hypothetical protein
MATPPTPAVGYLLLGAADPPPVEGGATDTADLAALLDALGAHSPTIEPDSPRGCWLDLRGGKARGL